MQRHAEDMVSLMRPHSLGGRGAVRNGHRERSDAPVRNAQAHAWQQRTRGAAGTSPTQLHPTTVFIYNTQHTQQANRVHELPAYSWD